MGLAKLVNAPVLLAGDIDRGGVFAQLYGTVALLEPEERARVRGLILNKFRGDVEILRPGLAQLEALTGVSVTGVVPWMELDVDDEDSLAPRLGRTAAPAAVDVAVIRLPHISNFTDFSPLEQQPGLGVRYVAHPRTLGEPDLVILPGTKNTLGDLVWLRQCGMEAALLKLAGRGTPILGVCGGYQMLGQTVSDPAGAEGEAGASCRGLGLLPTATEFAAEKHRTRVTGQITGADGLFAPLNGAHFTGYEIHMGSTAQLEGAAPLAALTGEAPAPFTAQDGVCHNNVMGLYIHGLFEEGDLAARLAALLMERKGLTPGQAPALSWAAYRETQYDRLADTMRAALDLPAIYRMMEGSGRN